MTPRHARLAVAAFVLLSAGVAGNVLFFQEAQAPGRSRGERTTVTSPTRTAIEPTIAPEPATSPSRPLIINAKSAVTTPLAPSPLQGRQTVDPLAAASGDAPEVIASIQRELQARGYDPGTPDGVAGLVTRAAVMAWESDNGLPPTGEPTEAVMKAIVLGVTPQAAQQISAQWQALPKERRGRAEQMLRLVQQSLSALGYNLGRVTGRMNEDTERAIREFETDQNLTASGRISGPLVARLTRLASAGRPAR